MTREKSREAGGRRPGSRLTREEITPPGESRAEGVQQGGRKDVCLIDAGDLLAKALYVGRIRIRGERREVVAVVDAIDAAQPVLRRKNMVEARGSKIITDQLQGTVERF